METNNKWSLTDEEKDKFISALTQELVLLRTKAESRRKNLLC